MHAGLLMTTKIVLSAPLPRVYEDTGNGKVAAMPAVAGQPGTLIGGDFKVEDLTRISKETVRHLCHLAIRRRAQKLSCSTPAGAQDCPLAPSSDDGGGLCSSLQACSQPLNLSALFAQARKLDTEVLAPMSRWNTAFHTVEVCPQFPTARRQKATLPLIAPPSAVHVPEIQRSLARTQCAIGACFQP